MSTPKDATAVAKTMADIATAMLSILNQIYQFLAISEARLAQAKSEEERYNITEDIKQLRDIQKKLEVNPDHKLTADEQKFLSKFSTLEINGELQQTAKEYLQAAYDSGAINGFSVERKPNSQMSVIYGYSKDSAYISKMMVDVQNAFKNKDVISKTDLINLKEIYNQNELKKKEAKEKMGMSYKPKEAKIVAFVSLDKDGITKADIEMLKEQSVDFKYHIGKDKNGKDTIFLLDKDINRLESQLIENRLMMTMSEQAILVNKAMHEDLLDDNLNIKNGKSVYMCSPDKDFAIIIGDDTFEVLQNGQSVDFALPGQQVEIVNGVEHYVNLKMGNIDFVKDQISKARHPIVLEEKEFIKDFSDRQSYLRQKMEEEITKETKMTPEIKKELDRLFDPSVEYELNNKTKSEKELIQVISGRKNEKLIDGITYDEWYKRMQMKHDKLNFDHKDVSMSGRCLDVLDYTKEVISARADNALDNEYKERILQDYKVLDMDEKEDILRIITGLTPDELKAISSYLDSYVHDAQLEDHAEFVEIVDPAVSEYWHEERDGEVFDKTQEDIDKANEEVERTNREETHEYDRDGNYIDDVDEDDFEI